MFSFSEATILILQTEVSQTNHSFQYVLLWELMSDGRHNSGQHLFLQELVKTAAIWITGMYQSNGGCVCTVWVTKAPNK